MYYEYFNRKQLIDLVDNQTNEIERLEKEKDEILEYCANDKFLIAAVKRMASTVAENIVLALAGVDKSEQCALVWPADGKVVLTCEEIRKELTGPLPFFHFRNLFHLEEIICPNLKVNIKRNTNVNQMPDALSHAIMDKMDGETLVQMWVTKKPVEGLVLPKDKYRHE